jgi:uncharacterized protein DUF3943
MKNINNIFVLFLTLITYAASSSQTTLPRGNNFAGSIRAGNLKEDGIKLQGTSLKDTSLYNSYGDLLNDDPKYNKKSPWWRPALGVVKVNLFTFAVGRYILNYPYTRIGFQSIKNNFKDGWEWDTDKFNVNFFRHPYSGAMSFNQARIHGYNFFESIPFAFGGSLMWEYLMENTRPSYNDLINTTVSGAFLGEVLYRLSSNVLDDRRSGFKRVLKELLAGLLNPVRGEERLLSGKVKRVTRKEIYQKEPIDVSLYTGVQNVNNGTGFWKGTNSAIININLVYGNPFEKRFRKPFDFFKLRADLSIGGGSKPLKNLMGYGILFGENDNHKNQEMLYGGFQHYDFWDSKIFEIGALAFGGGILHKYLLSESSDIVSQIHIGIVPFAGISSQYANLEERNYNFSGGMDAKLESTLNLGGLASISASYYLYALHTFVGASGNNVIGIFRPRITVNILQSISIGFEYLLYHKDGYLNDYPDVHARNSEQRIYLMIESGYFRFGL